MCFGIIESLIYYVMTRLYIASQVAPAPTCITHIHVHDNLLSWLGTCTRT